MKKSIGYLVCVGLLAGTLAGCGGGGEDSGNGGTGGDGNGSAASGAPQGGSKADSGGSQQASGRSLATPEETFAHFKTSMENDNLGDALVCLTPASQDIMLGLTVFGMSMAAGFSQDEEMQKSLDALLAEHGVNMEEPEEPPSGTDQQAAMEAAMKEMVGGVEDKAACMNALMAWSKANMDEENQRGTPLERIAQVELGEVTVDGDTAAADVVVDGMPDDKKMVFTKVDGKWLIDMIATEQAAGPPVPVE